MNRKQSIRGQEKEEDDKEEMMIDDVVDCRVVIIRKKRDSSNDASELISSSPSSIDFKCCSKHQHQHQEEQYEQYEQYEYHDRKLRELLGKKRNLEIFIENNQEIIDDILHQTTTTNTHSSDNKNNTYVRRTIYITNDSGRKKNRELQTLYTTCTQSQSRSTSISGATASGSHANKGGYDDECIKTRHDQSSEQEDKDVVVPPPPPPPLSATTQKGGDNEVSEISSEEIEEMVEFKKKLSPPTTRSIQNTEESNSQHIIRHKISNIEKQKEDDKKVQNSSEATEEKSDLKEQVRPDCYNLNQIIRQTLTREGHSQKVDDKEGTTTSEATNNKEEVELQKGIQLSTIDNQSSKQNNTNDDNGRQGENKIESTPQARKDELKEKKARPTTIGDNQSQNHSNSNNYNDLKHGECIEIDDDDDDSIEDVTPKRTAPSTTTKGNNENQKEENTQVPDSSGKLHLNNNNNKHFIIEIDDDSDSENSDNSDDIVIVGVSNPTKSKLDKKLKNAARKRQQMILDAKERLDESFHRSNTIIRNKRENSRLRSNSVPIYNNVENGINEDVSNDNDIAVKTKERSSSLNESSPSLNSPQKKTCTKQKTFSSQNFNYYYDEQTAMEDQDRLLRETASRVRKRGEELKKQGVWWNHYQQQHFSNTYQWNNNSSDRGCSSSSSSSSSRNMTGEREYSTNVIVQDVSKLPSHHWKAKNLWFRLGLPPNTGYEFVKKNYRKLCLLYHPDKSKCSNANDRFQAIKEAYESISEKLKS